MYAMTTVNAPNGVTNIASVNAYAAKFAISPMIINTIAVNKKFQLEILIPAHHVKFLRYLNPTNQCFQKEDKYLLQDLFHIFY